uniref:DUF4283 domain-containing protein n=1 Tax=Vitis vinifera TaxID=29760 RepID=A5AYC0_VITVI|nr:hypothetical protein VITISV_040289 [Vitis vinifera]
MSESEREREGEGVERESRAENRRKWKGISFGVESKVFEIGIEEKKGKPQVIIMESKRGWNPSLVRGDDLEKLGWLMASSWGLKGKLGLARLENGRVLLEFEFVEEARRVLISGKRLVGGLQVGLERWSPRLGCVEEDPSEAGPSSSALAEGMLGSKRDGGPSSQGPSMGENLKRVVDVGAGPAIGSSRSKGKGWAAVEGPSSLFGPSVLIRDSPGPAQTLLLDSGLSGKRKQQEETQLSTIDRALVEEASRYETVLNSWGLRVSRSSPSNSFSLGRTPEGEYYDHSGVLREDIQEGNMLRMLDADRSAESGNRCWDLVEVNCVDNKVQECGKWCCPGFHGSLWFFFQRRECLWEEIGAIRGIWEEPWCLGGDFNIILSQRERSRQGRITSAMRRFAQIIDDLGLVDLPLQEGLFTWSGGLNNQSWARLDRFLMTLSWLDQFSNVIQGRLPQPTSDHFPILLEGGGLRRGPFPFRFENMWLKEEGFKDLIRNWWQGIEVTGRASYRLVVKMKELKQNLKVWNRDVFERLESNKALALRQVDYWDLVESERSLTKEETVSKKEAKEWYTKWVSLEEIHGDSYQGSYG